MNARPHVRVHGGPLTHYLRGIPADAYRWAYGTRSPRQSG
jgi:hypothetical protein